jgi:hypothetical protein
MSSRQDKEKAVNVQVLLRCRYVPRAAADFSLPLSLSLARARVVGVASRTRSAVL